VIYFAESIQRNQVIRSHDIYPFHRRNIKFHLIQFLVFSFIQYCVFYEENVTELRGM